jgi:hypothetical protein
MILTIPRHPGHFDRLVSAVAASTRVSTAALVTCPDLWLINDVKVELAKDVVCLFPAMKL